MNRIIVSFSLYWHFILDIILTHVFVIAFLRAGFATTSALLMSTDAFLKILLSVFISRFVMKYRPSTRYKTSALLRLSLVGIWFIAISQLPVSNLTLLVFVPFLIFKVLLMVDSSLSSDLIFVAHDTFNIDVSKSAAAQNILVRASTAFAPAIALTLLSIPKADFIVVVAAILIGLGSTILLRKILFSEDVSRTPFQHEQSLSFTQLILNPIMRWGLIFQIVGNLSLAGVAFLFLAQLPAHGSVFLNEITALYAAFLVSQSVVLIFGERATPVSNTSQVALIMGICGSFVICASFSDPSLLRLTFCCGIGLTYSLMLSGVQKVVTSKLRGPGFIQYASWSQTLGRFTSFSITALLGLAMSQGFSPSILLTLSGVLGIISASLLMLTPVRITHSLIDVQQT